MEAPDLGLLVHVFIRVGGEGPEGGGRGREEGERGRKGWRGDGREEGGEGGLWVSEAHILSSLPRPGLGVQPGKKD